MQYYRLVTVTSQAPKPSPRDTRFAGFISFWQRAGHD